MKYLFQTRALIQRNDNTHKQKSQTPYKSKCNFYYIPIDICYYFHACNLPCLSNVCILWCWCWIPYGRYEWCSIMRIIIILDFMEHVIYRCTCFQQRFRPLEQIDRIGKGKICSLVWRLVDAGFFFWGLNVRQSIETVKPHPNTSSMYKLETGS